MCQDPGSMGVRVSLSRHPKPPPENPCLILSAVPTAPSDRSLRPTRRFIVQLVGRAFDLLRQAAPEAVAAIDQVDSWNHGGGGPTTCGAEEIKVESNKKNLPPG